MAYRAIPRRRTRWGLTIPGFGLGTGRGAPGEVQQAVTCALDAGYRFIDTAMIYDNDLEIGNALAPFLRHESIERKDIAITTKIAPIYMGVEDVRKSVCDSLEKLQLHYVDLLLLHAPFGMKNLGDKNFQPTDSDGNRVLENYDFVTTWKEMEKLAKCGKARQLGVSNCSIAQIEEIMARGRITPANLQLECHAYLQQDALREFCGKHRIVPSAYAPLGCPKYRSQKTSLLDDPVVNEIAWKLGKTPAQVLIRFVAQLGVIPLPKSMSPKRIVENYEAMFFEIPDEDFETLRALNCGMKYYTFDWAKPHPRYPVGGF